MSASTETQVAQRQILIVGPYGVRGTGVVDAVAENRQRSVTTAAPTHVSVDLMDREGTTKAFSSLDKVTDLVFAAYLWTSGYAAVSTPRWARRHPIHS